MTRALVLAILLLLTLAPRILAEDHEETEPEAVLVEEAVAEVQEVAPLLAPVFVPYVQPLTIPELIDAAAYRWGVSAALMRRITWCESRWNPGVVSPWGDRGIAQFNRITWQEQAPLAGYPANFDAAFDPVMSLDLMGRLISRGQSWRWRTCL